jgi:hypothetical protein
MREAVGAVDESVDAPLARHRAESLHRKDVSRRIGHVADQKDPRARGDGALDSRDQLVRASRGSGKGNGLEDDPIPRLPLTPGGEHPGIVLGGGQDFIALLQVEPELNDLHRLGGVPGDGDLLRIAAESVREPAPHDFDPRAEHLVDVVGRAHVGDVPVLVHRRLHRAGSGADTSAVEVYRVPVDGERVTDAEPEILVLSRSFGTRLQDRPESRESLGRKRGQAAPGRG